MGNDCLAKLPQHSLAGGPTGRWFLRDRSRYEVQADCHCSPDNDEEQQNPQEEEEGPPSPLSLGE